jgi:hypothetical protein
MKVSEIVLIVMTFTLLCFEYAANIKTLVYSNTIIVSKTILSTKTSKHFAHVINTNCFFKSDRITRIVFSVTSTTFTIIIQIMNAIKQNTRVFDTLSRCDTIKTFDWILSSSKNRFWDYHRINDTIQMFKVHCNQDVSTRTKNFKLKDMQIISIKSFELYLIFCAMYNSQRSFKNNKWSDLCTNVSLMKKKCFLKQIDSDDILKKELVTRNNSRSTFLQLLIEKSDNWDFCWSDHSNVETSNLIVFLLRMNIIIK